MNNLSWILSVVYHIPTVCRPVHMALEMPQHCHMLHGPLPLQTPLRCFSPMLSMLEVQWDHCLDANAGWMLFSILKKIIKKIKRRKKDLLFRMSPALFACEIHCLVLHDADVHYKSRSTPALLSSPATTCNVFMFCGDKPTYCSYSLLSV